MSDRPAIPDDQGVIPSVSGRDECYHTSWCPSAQHINTPHFEGIETLEGHFGMRECAVCSGKAKTSGSPNNQGPSAITKFKMSKLRSAIKPGESVPTSELLDRCDLERQTSTAALDWLRDRGELAIVGREGTSRIWEVPKMAADGGEQP